MNLSQKAWIAGLVAGGLLGYSLGLSIGRNETQVSAYNEGINDGIQYADDTAREGSNCGIRPPYPRYLP